MSTKRIVEDVMLEGRSGLCGRSVIIRRECGELRKKKRSLCESRKGNRGSRTDFRDIVFRGRGMIRRDADGARIPRHAVLMSVMQNHEGGQKEESDAQNGQALLHNSLFAYV